MWIENTDIKEGTFETTTPESISSYIKPCTILSVGGGTSEHLTINGLEVWLNAYIITNFC